MFYSLLPPTRLTTVIVSYNFKFCTFLKCVIGRALCISLGNLVTDRGWMMTERSIIPSVVVCASRRRCSVLRIGFFATHKRKLCYRYNVFYQKEKNVCDQKFTSKRQNLFRFHRVFTETSKLTLGFRGDDTDSSNRPVLVRTAFPRICVFHHCCLGRRKNRIIFTADDDLHNTSKQYRKEFTLQHGRP